MKILIKKADSSDAITCTIHVGSLVTAVNNCNLELGTLSNPIRADGFVDITDIAHFKNGEKIVIKVSTDNDFSLQLICCSITNVTKNKDLGAEATQSLLQDIFVIEDNTMQLLPNGSIIINSGLDGTKCKIKIRNKSFPETYVSYSILFSMFIPTGTVSGDGKTYCFVVDPFIRVSSSVPAPSITYSSNE